MEKERSRLPVTRVREYSSSSSSSPLNRVPRLYVPPQRRDGKREPRREGRAALSLNSSAVLIGSTGRTTRYLSFFFILASSLAFFLSFTLSVDRERLGNSTFPLKRIYFRSTRHPKTGREEEPDSPLRSKKHATARKSV